MRFRRQEEAQLRVDRQGGPHTHLRKPEGGTDQCDSLIDWITEINCYIFQKDQLFYRILKKT